MGRWREAPEGLNVNSPIPRLRRVLPRKRGRVIRFGRPSSPRRSRRSGRRWPPAATGKRLAASGRATSTHRRPTPPHSWGGGAKRRRGSTSTAPSPGFAGYFPASGEELLGSDGLHRRAGAAEADGDGLLRQPGKGSPLPGEPQARIGGQLLPIHGEVARSAGGAQRQQPIPRLRRVLPRKRGRVIRFGG